MGLIFWIFQSPRPMCITQPKQPLAFHPFTWPDFLFSLTLRLTSSWLSSVSLEMWKARNRESLVYPACRWRLVEVRLGKRGASWLLHRSDMSLWPNPSILWEKKHHFLEFPRHLHGVNMDPRSFTLKASQEMSQTSWLWISLVLYVTWIPMV